jgi:hypothetical protein
MLEKSALFIVNTVNESSYCIIILSLPTKYIKSRSEGAWWSYLHMLWHRCDDVIFHFLLHIAPSPPSLLSFADVANTSLAITWKGPPDWTDYNDFELQWLPRDALTVFNPYSNRKSEGRIVYGLRPGRSYQFSVKTVSGDSWKTYSKPISGSVRTSMTWFAFLEFQLEGELFVQYLILIGVVWIHIFWDLLDLNSVRSLHKVLLFNILNNGQ